MRDIQIHNGPKLYLHDSVVFLHGSRYHAIPWLQKYFCSKMGPGTNPEFTSKPRSSGEMQREILKKISEKLASDSESYLKIFGKSTGSLTLKMNSLPTGSRIIRGNPRQELAGNSRFPGKFGLSFHPQNPTRLRVCLMAPSERRASMRSSTLGSNCFRSRR